MKISAATIEILKNFADINPGIVINPNSNIVRTISRSISIFGEASIPETFPEKISLYKMDGLLTALAFTKDPEINVHSNYLEVVGKGFRTKVVFSPEEMIEGFKSGAPKGANFPNAVLNFTLSEEALSQVLGVAGKLQLDTIEVTNRNGVLTLRAYDKIQATENDFELDIGDLAEKYNVPFRFIFKKDNLVMLPGTYQVSVSVEKPVARFTLVSTNTSLIYYIVTETNSEFNTTGK